MIRLLFPLFLIVGVLWWLKTLGRKGPGAHGGPSGPSGQENERHLALPMVACDQCGTHLPEVDALKRQGRWYCCAQHRDQQG